MGCPILGACLAGFTLALPETFTKINYNIFDKIFCVFPALWVEHFLEFYGKLANIILPEHKDNKDVNNQWKRFIHSLRMRRFFIRTTGPWSKQTSTSREMDESESMFENPLVRQILRVTWYYTCRCFARGWYVLIMADVKNSAKNTCFAHCLGVSGVLKPFSIKRWNTFLKSVDKWTDLVGFQADKARAFCMWSWRWYFYTYWIVCLQVFVVLTVWIWTSIMCPGKTQTWEWTMSS